MELVDALHRSIAKEHPGKIKLRQFKVTGVSGNTVTVDDRGEPLPGNRYLASYSPAVNDVVWAIVDSDADIIILGKLA